MKRLAWTAATLAAFAAGGTGFWLEQAGSKPPSHQQPSVSAHADVTAQTPVDPRIAYYRDPSGKPFYSPEPRNDPDGKAFLPVHVDEDVSFEDKPPSVEADTQAQPRRILYYRNLMGLADISQVPKKDSMGMDYVPVYDDEGNGTAVKVSAEKLQRTGVRFDTATLRNLSQPIHAPGTLNEDERRISVVSLRSEAFVEAVRRCHDRQPGHPRESH